MRSRLFPCRFPRCTVPLPPRGGAPSGTPPGLPSECWRAPSRQDHSLGCGLSPTPTFTRGNASVPRLEMIDLIPLWPPAEPFLRTRMRPTGRLNVVKNHDDPLRRDFIKVRAGLNAQARRVHIRLGLDENQALSLVVAHADLALEFRLVHAYAERLGKQIECEKAGIVPGLFILPAGVAETRNEPGLGSVGRKKHIRTERTSSVSS